jgi:WXG100 family type VII secretion target
VDDFSINFGQAETVLDDVERINQRIKGSLDDLERNVERSLSSWESEQARTAYAMAKARWDQAALEMTTHLDEARVTLAEVIETYRRADNNNRVLFEA